MIYLRQPPTRLLAAIALPSKAALPAQPLNGLSPRAHLRGVDVAPRRDQRLRGRRLAPLEGDVQRSPPHLNEEAYQVNINQLLITECL